MHLKSLLTVGISAVILGACQPVPPQDTGTSGRGVPVVTNPQIGQQKIPASKVSSLFDRFCYNHAPSFAGAPAAMAADGGFLQDRKTKIYFHQTLNLSVKLHKKGSSTRCSMVFWPTKRDVNAVLNPYTRKAGALGGIQRRDNIFVALNADTAKSVFTVIPPNNTALLSMIVGR